MPFSSRKKRPFNTHPANRLGPQSTQQLPPVCTWSAHAPQSGPSPLPFPRNRHTLTATATAAGELFLFGGYVRGSASSDLHVFSTRDFSTTLMQTSGEVPIPHIAHGAALVGTTLLICGGTTNSGDQNVLNHGSLYLLNLVSREWTRVLVNGPGPNSLTYHTTTVVGSKLFVFGGQIGGNVFNDMWALDLNCLKSQPLWESYEPTPGNDKPLPRTGHVAVTTEDRIIVFGGSDCQHYHNDTWSFDISTRKWAKLQCTGSIPSPRRGHAAVLVDDIMYVFGGFTGHAHLDDLTALQLSTQRWFKFHDVGPSPHRRSYHTMASDGTRVFVLGGNSKGARADEISLIHVFDTKHIKYPGPERAEPNAVYPNDRTIQLARKSSTGPPTQEQPQHPALSSFGAHGSFSLRNATPAVSSSLASPQITLKRNPGPNGRSLQPTEDGDGEGSTEYHAKLVAPDTSSEKEVAWLEHERIAYLERQLSETLAAKTERDRHNARLTDQLAQKSALLEQAEANAAEAKKHAGLELRELQAKLDESMLSRDEHLRPLEQTQSALQKATSRAADAAERSQPVCEHEMELAEVRAELEGKKSELEAVRLRLMDAENRCARAEADTLRPGTQAGAILVNTDVDQVIHRLTERMRTMEAETALLRGDEKSIEEMECRNEE